MSESVKRYWAYARVTLAVDVRVQVSATSKTQAFRVGADLSEWDEASEMVLQDAFEKEAEVLEVNVLEVEEQPSEEEEG